MRFKGLKYIGLSSTGGGRNYSLLFVLVAVLATLAVLVALFAWAARPAQAQAQLNISDFDHEGVEAEMLAVVLVDSSINGATNHDILTATSGLVVQGSVEVGPDVGGDTATLTQIRYNVTNTRLVLREGNADFDIGAYFDTGNGTDLMARIQTLDGTHTWTLDGTQEGTNNGGGARFDMPAEAITLVQDLNAGERVIVALVREDLRPRLVPDPATITATVDTNQEFSLGNTGRLQNVTITETQGTGDATLRTTEAGIDCGNQTNKVDIASASTFWARWCSAGDITFRVKDSADFTNFRDYTITIVTPSTPPDFGAETATREVPENSDEDTNVGDPVAATGTGTITYSMTGGAGNFDIATATGQIQVAANPDLDHETTESYDVVVTATDERGDTDTITVTISVADVNEAPDLDQGNQRFNIPEYSAAGTNVGTAFTAKDPDDGDSITWSDSSDEFDINTSGQLQVATGASLDFEGTNTFVFAVMATDTGGINDAVTVTVNLTDVGPSVTAVTVGNIAETSARVSGTLAETPDGTPAFFRDRAGGGSWSHYSSSETEGGSTVHNATGLSKDTNYTVAVSTETGFGTATTRTVTFRTLPNSAPVFPGTTTTRSIHNHAPAGTAVGAPVTASDTDTLTYTLGGTDAASFQIDSATGQITVGSGTTLDQAVTATYSVTVTARDPDGETDSITVSIGVTFPDHVEPQGVKGVGLLERVCGAAIPGNAGLPGCPVTLVPLIPLIGVGMLLAVGVRNPGILGGLAVLLAAGTSTAIAPNPLMISFLVLAALAVVVSLAWFRKV